MKVFEMQKNAQYPMLPASNKARLPDVYILKLSTSIMPHPDFFCNMFYPIV